MALKVKEVTSDEVFPRLVATLHESYSKPYNGFWDIFKGRSGEECQTRFAQWHNSDPIGFMWKRQKPARLLELRSGTFTKRTHMQKPSHPWRLTG